MEHVHCGIVNLIYCTVPWITQYIFISMIFFPFYFYIHISSLLLSFSWQRTNIVICRNMHVRAVDRIGCQISYEPLNEFSAFVWRLSISLHWGNSDMHLTTCTMTKHDTGAKPSANTIYDLTVKISCRAIYMVHFNKKTEGAWGRGWQTFSFFVTDGFASSEQ